MRPAVRNPYAHLPGTDAVIPSGPGAEGWAEARLDQLAMPALYGVDVFLRHTRHAGCLTIRRRALQRPGASRQGVKRVILAWRPRNEGLPTAITIARSVFVDRSLLVSRQPGTRLVEVRRLDGTVLHVPVLSWPPEVVRPHPAGNHHVTQWSVPSEQLGPIVWRQEPHARIHPE